MLLDGVRKWLGGPDKDAAVRSCVPSPERNELLPSASPVPFSGKWPQARIAVAESLWGEGFLFPGGEEETLRLVKPLGLSAAAGLLLVGAGAGGPARATS